jgi:hypothetical protein
VNLLKQKLDEWPNLRIPELQYVTDRDWLDAANDTENLASDKDYHWDLRQLLGAGEDHFGSMAMSALQKYANANNQQFPTNLSQLEPYFDPPVDDAILQRYEIVPAKTIRSANSIEQYKNTEWLIAQKMPDDENYGTNDSREVIGVNGYGFPGNAW